jgi:hypothetical protein
MGQRDDGRDRRMARIGNIEIGHYRIPLPPDRPGHGVSFDWKGLADVAA